jgi:hypothetical protein
MARIYGPDPASLMGKTKLIKPTAVKIENVPRPIFVSQVLHVNVMFVEGDPFFISVGTPLSLTIVSHLGGK